MPLKFTLQQNIPNAIMNNNILYERTVYGSSEIQQRQKKKKAGGIAAYIAKPTQLAYFVNDRG